MFTAPTSTHNGEDKNRGDSGSSTILHVNYLYQKQCYWLSGRPARRKFHPDEADFPDYSDRSSWREGT